MSRDKRVWVIGSGETARDYSSLFLDYDLMFLGPATAGRFDADVYGNEVREGRASKAEVGMIRRFVDEVQVGDGVVLRVGKQIKRVGYIPEGEGYEFREDFNDIWGWDLGHTRRVIWGQAELDFAEREGRSSRFYQLGQQPLLEEMAPYHSQIARRELKSLPDALPAPLEGEKLGQALFAKGLANDAVDKVLAAIQHQRRLGHWYDSPSQESLRPTEHEIVAHMVLPLMTALGWSEQLLAVEWHRIDLAAFRRTPTAAADCALVCEAKRRGHGLQNVIAQPIQYVDTRKLGNCAKILLTDGTRFYLYQKRDDNWLLAGYVNVDSIGTNHLAAAGADAIRTIMAMTPAHIDETLPPCQG